MRHERGAASENLFIFRCDGFAFCDKLSQMVQLASLFIEASTVKRQHKREPLTLDEANRLANACESHEEKLVIWTLLDTGLRVSELAGLSKSNIDWQMHRLIFHGKGGPYGKRSKRRVVPISTRVQALIERHFAIHDGFGLSVRTIRPKMSEAVTSGKVDRKRF
jgi:integrase/recombinase XerD